MLAAPVRNVYAEIGTTFASIVITFPTVCAHILGQLLKFMGEDRIVFGSDCGLVRLAAVADRGAVALPDPRGHAPEVRLSGAHRAVKRKILGLNSARLYKLHDEGDVSRHGVYRPVPRNYDTQVPLKLKTLLEYPGLTGDLMSQARREYLEMGAQPSHTRYGWVRTQV